MTAKETMIEVSMFCGTIIGLFGFLIHVLEWI